MRVPMKNFTTFILACLLSAPPVIAQKLLVLSHNKKSSEKHRILISEGSRVKCKLTDGSKVAGTMEKIFTDTIHIGSQPVAIRDIQAIAKRRKGAMAVIASTQIIPFAVMIAASEKGNFPIEVGSFAVFAIGSHVYGYYLYEYPLRNVKKNWALTVLEKAK